jgi:hypothetical protein
MVHRRSLSRSPRRRQSRREARIIEDIVVDAYGAEERAMGWYYYLEGRLRFPFQAKCVRHEVTSPLRVGEIISVAKMAPEEHCGSDMIVLTQLNGRSFGVPLSQLQPRDVDADSG